MTLASSPARSTVRPGDGLEHPRIFKPGHLGRGGELLLIGQRDKICSECHHPFVSTTASAKTCSPVCSDIRERRMEKAARIRERVNRNLSALPKPKRGRPPKPLLVERKPPTRSGKPDEAKAKCQ
jgi:hypothetical protein